LAAIGQTVSGLAHCIKNILNGIRSGSAVIDRSLREGDSAKVREGWRVVRRNNGMLSNLVLDMLSLAREAKPHPFPTDVNDLVQQVCELMAEQAGQHGVRIDCTPATDLEDILTDPAHLYRCLLNLVSNAVDACGEGGCVKVRVYRGRGRSRVTLSVMDDGMGIGPELRRKLFTEFFTTKGGRGTGLGLPVVKKLVTQLRGEIKLHSVPGFGTRFVIALPVRCEPAETQETRA